MKELTYNQRPRLLIPLMFVCVMMIYTKTLHSQDFTFENGDFESSITCDPESCVESDVACVDGWWNYRAPQGTDDEMWVSYDCEQYPICGGQRGIIVSGRETPQPSAPATYNPFYGANPAGRYLVSCTFMPLPTPPHNTFFITVFGSNQMFGPDLSQLEILGVKELNANVLTCNNVDIPLETEFDPKEFVTTTYEYLVFGVSFSDPRAPDDTTSASVKGILDNFSACSFLDVFVETNPCDQGICFGVDVDYSCFNPCYQGAIPVGEFGDSIGQSDCYLQFEVFNDTLSVLFDVDDLEDTQICLDSLHPGEYCVGYLGQLAFETGFQVFADTICVVLNDCGSYEVTSNENWTTSTTLPEAGVFNELRIKQGSRLVVDNDVQLEFCPAGKVIIEPGAELFLGGTLTSACDTPWQGVIVDGDGGSSQFQGPIGLQGSIYVQKGSIIENAHVGIDCKLENENKASGGIVVCDGTLFRNNHTSVRIRPYQNRNYYTGDPLPYTAAFKDCDFIVDENYESFFSDPMFAFAYLQGVYDIPFSGCHFTNGMIPTNATNVYDFGNGILAIRAGFRVTPSSNRNPRFLGLGYGVRTVSYSGNRPYLITKSTFENCYVGIAGSYTSFGSIYSNEFVLGTVPSVVPGATQSGVYLENYQSGFQLQDNVFSSNKTNATDTRGIIASNLGDMDNVIRNNLFDGDFLVGNQGDRVNSDLTNPDRGLYYTCNTNIDIEDYDFFVPEIPASSLRSVQAEILATGEELATGNKFSRTGDPNVGDFFGNFVLGVAPDYYYYDDPALVEEPLNFTGLNSTILADPNTCEEDVCEDPPCVESTDISGLITEFETLKSNIGSMSGMLKVYSQERLDQISTSMAHYYLKDTSAVGLDSLRNWYGRMASITGELLLAGQYVEEGDFSSAITLLTTLSSRYTLNADQLAGVNDIKDITTILSTEKADSLSAQSKTTLLPIALSNRLSSGHAQALLLLNGYDFNPDYIVITLGKAPIVEDAVGQRPEYGDNRDIVSIYPNPSSGDMYLRVNEPEVLNKEVSFEVFDLQGKAVMGLNIVSETTFLDLKDKGLVSGVYAYILTYDNGKIFSGKLVVE